MIRWERNPARQAKWCDCSRTVLAAATRARRLGIHSQAPGHRQEPDASGAEPETTNNRMELMGVIEGLASLKRPCQVELVTDSQYVAKGISEWLPNWKRRVGSGKRKAN